MKLKTYPHKIKTLDEWTETESLPYDHTGETDELVTEESGGMKADGNKIRPELFPMETMLAISDVLTFGAEKYEDNNWKKVDPERYKGALLRHLAAIDMGETIDPDSGLPHIDHVACNAVFLSYLDYGSEK